MTIAQEAFTNVTPAKVGVTFLLIWKNTYYITWGNLSTSLYAFQSPCNVQYSLTETGELFTGKTASGALPGTRYCLYVLLPATSSIHSI